MVKKIVIVLMVFFLGFFSHAFFFPGFIFMGKNTGYVKKLIGSDQKNKSGQPNTSLSLTSVSFNKRGFMPDNVIIKKGYYIAITNKEEKDLMFLISDNPYLRTPRGYGYTEEVATRLDVLGEFTVVNKLNQNQVLGIKVVK